MVQMNLFRWLFGRRRRRYPFRRIERAMGPWQPSTARAVLPGTRLPQTLELPEAVKRWGDRPGDRRLTDVLFPYWLRIDPALAGFVARRVAAGGMYSERTLPREGASPRTISAPVPLLKLMQRRLLRRVLEQIDVHDAAHGFVRGRSVFSAAAAHAGQRVVACLDLRDFFGTITFARAVGFFKACGLTGKTAFLLGGLCCYKGRLPQGAPTSPMLANLICRRLDARLYGLAVKHGFAYTRYADDLIFSGPDRLVGFLPIVRKIVEDEGFRPAEEKTRVMRSGSRQKVLGLNVNTRVSVPKRVRRLVRAMVHRQAQAAVPDAGMTAFLAGHLAFMMPAHPAQTQRLREKLGISSGPVRTPRLRV